MIGYSKEIQRKKEAIVKALGSCSENVGYTALVNVLVTSLQEDGKCKDCCLEYVSQAWDFYTHALRGKK